MGKYIFRTEKTKVKEKIFSTIYWIKALNLIIFYTFFIFLNNLGNIFLNHLQILLIIVQNWRMRMCWKGLFEC
jgi:hypothetical protein